jgi:hypothetical protein
MDVFLNLYFSIRFVTIFAFGTYKYEEGHFNKYKEVVIICEEDGLVTINYNVILTTPNINTMAKTIISNISTKSLLICINL